MAHASDYAAVAAIMQAAMKDTENDRERELLRTVAARLADHFAQDNGRFVRARFLLGSGVHFTVDGSTMLPDIPVNQRKHLRRE